MTKIKLGIIREAKKLHDKRVPLTPQQCRDIIEESNVEIYVQPCDFRCYSNEEYKEFGIPLKEDISDCDILLSIKEVETEILISNKKYLFFSHTIKKQPHNRQLLRTILQKKIQLIDYECITDKQNNRIIGFGRYAGIVGAYNGILGYGKKYDLFHLKPANQFRDRIEMDEELKRVRLPNVKIIVTGGGRVANGAMETLGALKIRKVTPYEFLNYSFREPVYVQLQPEDYHAAKDKSPWNTEHFYQHPEEYVSTFSKYIPHCDLLIHCSFWDPKAPVLFTKEEMRNTLDFRISVIADVSCDINGGIPSTTKPSSIEDPFYGYNPLTEKIDVPFHKHTITIMAVPNLPCELPRDAAEDFGKNLMERVLPSLLFEDKEGIIERASITKNGHLTSKYEYLSDYVAE